MNSVCKSNPALFFRLFYMENIGLRKECLQSTWFVRILCWEKIWGGDVGTIRVSFHFLHFFIRIILQCAVLLRKLLLFIILKPLFCSNNNSGNDWKSIGKYKERKCQNSWIWLTIARPCVILPNWWLVIWPIYIAPLLDKRHATNFAYGYLFDNLYPASPVNRYHFPARKSSASLFSVSWVNRFSLSASFSSLYDEHGSFAIRIDI